MNARGNRKGAAPRKGSWPQRYPWYMLLIGACASVLLYYAAENLLVRPITVYIDQAAVKKAVIKEISDNCEIIQLYYACMGGLPETKKEPWRPLLRLYTPFYNAACEKVDLIDDERLKNGIHELYKKYNDVISRTDYLIAEDRFNSLMATKGIDDVNKFRATIGDSYMDYYKNVIEQNNNLIKELLNSSGNGSILMFQEREHTFSKDWSKEEVLRETLRIYKRADFATAPTGLSLVSKRSKPIVFKK